MPTWIAILMACVPALFLRPLFAAGYSPVWVALDAIGLGLLLL